MKLGPLPRHNHRASGRSPGHPSRSCAGVLVRCGHAARSGSKFAAARFVQSEIPESRDPLVLRTAGISPGKREYFGRLLSDPLCEGRTSLPAASSASTIGDRPRALPRPSTAADNATPEWLKRNRRIPGAPPKPNRSSQVDQPNSVSSASAASHSMSGYRVKSEGLLDPH